MENVMVTRSSIPLPFVTSEDDKLTWAVILRGEIANSLPFSIYPLFLKPVLEPEPGTLTRFLRVVCQWPEIQHLASTLETRFQGI
jgi:hypothetical protein